MDDLSEEMKMILALADHLDLEFKATGGKHTKADIDSSLFDRLGTEYVYTVNQKP